MLANDGERNHSFLKNPRQMAVVGSEGIIGWRRLRLAVLLGRTVHAAAGLAGFPSAEQKQAAGRNLSDSRLLNRLRRRLGGF
jgi:hypothetical protein